MGLLGLDIYLNTAPHPVVFVLAVLPLVVLASGYLNPDLNMEKGKEGQTGKRGVTCLFWGSHLW